MAQKTDLPGWTHARRLARTGVRICAPLAIWCGLAAAAPLPETLTIKIAKVRSANGLIMVCLADTPRSFNDCAGSPTARLMTYPAAKAGSFVIANLAPGRYAIAVLHDENGDGRLNRIFGIPSEGFGFSVRNELFGAPRRFADAGFDHPIAARELRIKLNYL